MKQGTRFVVANGRSTMRLRTLDAALRGFSVVETVGKGAAVAPQGVYLVVRLAVRNRVRQPARFSAGQTLLVVGDARYDERADVERRVYRDALAHSRRGAIQPGGQMEGSVVFDIPVSEIERVMSEGTLNVANFDGNPRGRQPEFGQFRIFLR